MQFIVQGYQFSCDVNLKVSFNFQRFVASRRTNDKVRSCDSVRVDGVQSSGIGRYSKKGDR